MADANQPGHDDLRDLVRDRRLQYETAGIDVADLHADPIEQWLVWHADALALGVAEPNAVVLATVDAAGVPSARAVLVRGVDARGLAFFTNYESLKSIDLDSNSRVAGVFAWLDIHRQVRVRGTAERMTPQESDDYFASRPRGSQIGAWASPQSQVIADRAELERLVAAVTERFEGVAEIPRPPFWGGWRLVPDEFEFWQGRASRLHDRLRYRRNRASGAWVIERLAP